MRIAVFAAVNMKDTVLCNVTLFSLAEFSDIWENLSPKTQLISSILHDVTYYSCASILLCGILSFLVHRQYFVIIS